MKILIDARSPLAFQKVYGLSLTERLLRQLFELGVREGVSVVLPPQAPVEALVSRDFSLRFSLAFDAFHSEASFAELVDSSRLAGHATLLLQGDGVYDDRVLNELLRSETSLGITGGEDANAPLAVVIQPSDLGRLETGPRPLDMEEGFRQGAREGWLRTLSTGEMDPYIAELRRRASPLLVKPESEKDLRRIENEMYEKTFKGSIDLIASHVYRIPVRELTRWLAPTPVTPNQVTAVSILCSFAAIPFFAAGWMGTGLVLAWIFVIADSLDGKLARLTVRLSKTAGHADHFTSPLFEACYYLAWGWHLSDGSFSGPAAQAGIWLFGFFGLDRIVTSIFGLRFGRSLLDYHVPDAQFHKVAARRNINFFIMTLGVVSGRPTTALYVITAWMGVTLLWHMYRFALHARRSRAS